MNICSYCRDPECRVPEARARLGYTTCIDCGEQVASKLTEQRKKQTAPAYNKGAYQYITINDTKSIGR
jgi:hypothetical protein